MSHDLRDMEISREEKQTIEIELQIMSLNKMEQQKDQKLKEK